MFQKTLLRPVGRPWRTAFSISFRTWFVNREDPATKARTVFKPHGANKENTKYEKHYSTSTLFPIPRYKTTLAKIGWFRFWEHAHSVEKNETATEVLSQAKRRKASNSIFAFRAFVLWYFHDNFLYF